MRQFCIRNLSEHYILKRWTKEARVGTFVDKDGFEIGSYGADSFMARHSHLTCIFTALIDKASSSKERFQVLVSKCADLQLSVQEVKSNNASGKSIHNGPGIIISNIVEYHDPQHVTTNGCAKRLKSSKEKATKGRLCRGCNKRDVSHNKRNCSVLLNRWRGKDEYNDPNLHLDSSESSEDYDVEMQCTEVASICCSGIWRLKCTPSYFGCCVI